MKSAEEFLDKILNNTFKLSTKNKLIKVMEEYAQYKVNELNKSDVIKSVCEHKNSEVRYVNSKITNRCIDCGEWYEQTVL